MGFHSETVAEANGQTSCGLILKVQAKVVGEKIANGQPLINCDRRTVAERPTQMTVGPQQGKLRLNGPGEIA
ncbi:MAG: hypothetical protein DMG32_07830 [Acidobacteria bacterium]|nr:MAG: hypothetical protein DMG32_07830 [Acidobacteriota bacterium]